MPLLCAGVLSAAPDEVSASLDVRVPMRDGVHLSANVFRPDAPRRYPTILVRTPYGKGAGLSSTYAPFVRNGYAVVVQDVRGRYASEGVFRPLEQEPADGDDTLNWIARQPWSDGKIGMLGGSYLGIVQWKVATLHNSHLKAMFPSVSGCDDYMDRFYSSGGAMKLGQRLLWMSENLRAPHFHPDFGAFVLHLPLRTSDVAATGQTSDMYQEAIAHPADDSFWKSISVREQLDQIRVPVFSVGGWFDNFVESDLAAYEGLRKHSDVDRILIGPWPHNKNVKLGVDFGPAANIPLRPIQMQWFDQFLKGRDTPLLSEARVRVFLMGVNRWRDAEEWPPRARLERFYLRSRGHANTLAGDGRLDLRAPADSSAAASAADRFVFDPQDPVPTAGGAVCCNPKVFPWGPTDQRAVERRRDVLVYTTAPLRRDVEVIGTVRVVLFAATSARDTDFTAKLVDVFPDGRAQNLTDGILRLRYRKSLEQPALARPGEICRLTIDAGVTGNVFLKGHRIRMEISSSNFPRFDRNPNTGGPVADAIELHKARQTIYHDARRPSYLLLPVVQN
ncbi:MAG TPA: CocE/NonD family hydrolase [Bryobacteraceae bacterium]|nr:CocE/NonD family hydrolase [Bryobacteraceae bacterium]